MSPADGVAAHGPVTNLMVVNAVLWFDVPVNPRDLGNRFGLLLLELPVQVEDGRKRVRAVQRAMASIKRSHAGLLAYGILGGLGLTPPLVESRRHRHQRQSVQLRRPGDRRLPGGRRRGLGSATARRRLPVIGAASLAPAAHPHGRRVKRLLALRTSTHS